MVIDAVLFDWGDTLMPYDAQADDEFVLARTRAGLAALEGRVDVAPEAVTGWFREHFDELFASEVEEDFDHLEMLARCFRELGANPTDDDVLIYAQASNWESEMLLFPHAHALLALDELGVEAANALFVGDRVRQDVRGAHDAGMVTVQALWSRADEHPDGVAPDYEAYTMMDVLNVVRRLNGGR